MSDELKQEVTACASDILKMVMEAMAEPEGGIGIDQVEGLIMGHLQSHFASDEYMSVTAWKMVLVLQKERDELKSAALAEKPAERPAVTGETSDGYHTFNELYEHRHALFSVICASFDGWKSMLHEDGTMFDGWFIAGVPTPLGQATYHLPLEWWAKFKAHIVPRAPKWDGHTAQQVPERIASLSAERPQLSAEQVSGLTTVAQDVVALAEHGLWGGRRLTVEMAKAALLTGEAEKVPPVPVSAPGPYGVGRIDGLSTPPVEGEQK